MHDPIHSNLKFDSKIIDVNLLYGAYSEEQRRRRPLLQRSFVLGLMGWGSSARNFASTDCG
jgi:hypothetical protein